MEIVHREALESNRNTVLGLERQMDGLNRTIQV